MDISSFPILSLIIFLPLVGAVVVAFIPRRNLGAIRATALAFALATWVVSLWLVLGFLPGREMVASAAGSFQYVQVADWVPAFGIQYKLGVDGISLLLVVLTTLLTWISILASFGPIKERVKEYMISFLILEVGMLGVFLALDLFLFYVFWEVVLVPMYLIIGIWGGPNRIYATLKFVLYTLVGSLLMLVAILATAFAFAAAHGGAFAGAFDYEQLRGFPFTDVLQTGAFLAFFLAFAIKVPMVPFHTWLPDAHVEAPTAGAVILAGAIVAMAQTDLKKLIPYSSVSHMGFVTLGIFIFQQQGLQGAVLQMVNHGLITGALFLLGGVIYERGHDRAIARMGGLAGATRVYAVAFGFFMLASIGLPGLAGFVGEFLVFQGP